MYKMMLKLHNRSDVLVKYHYEYLDEVNTYAVINIIEVLYKGVDVRPILAVYDIDFLKYKIQRTLERFTIAHKHVE